jgi:metal-dependent amidase/aminoacylase/carboxypeptidase family protein
MEELGEPINKDIREGSGSTDAGNVSHVVPTLHPYIKIGPNSLVGHTIELCKAACSQEGDKSLIIGAKSLSLTALNIFVDDKKLKEIKREFKSNKSL